MLEVLERVGRGNNIENDFVKINSLVGTYITNQVVDVEMQDGKLSSHQEVRSLITFDKGGQWRPLQPPELDSEGNEYEHCDADHGCYLQIHNSISNALDGFQKLSALHNAAYSAEVDGLRTRFLSVAAACSPPNNRYFAPILKCALSGRST